MATEVTNSKEVNLPLDDEITSSMNRQLESSINDTQLPATKDSKTRSSIQSEGTDALVTKNRNSSSTNNNQTADARGSQGAGTSSNAGSKLQQSQGKNSALKGKVSTSLKATWTVNRSSYGQTHSRLDGPSSTKNNDLTSDTGAMVGENAVSSVESGRQMKNMSQLRVE